MTSLIERTAERSTRASAAESLWRPSLFNRRTLWAALFLGGVVWALAQAGLFQRELVNPGGWTLALRFAGALLHPELSPAFLGLTLDAALTTLAFAVSAVFLSTLFGFFGGILASQVWWQSLLSAERTGWRTPWLLARSPLAALRAVHEVIWGLFFINVIGLNPLSAILAIAIPFGAIIAKVFSEILDESPRQPLNALLNSGVSAPKAFVYALLPQAFSDFLSYSFYRFECAIRSAAVLGIIGAGGLGYQIFLSLQTLKYEQIWTLLFALFLLNGLADFWSSLLRRRIGGGVRCAGDCLDREGVQGRASPHRGAPIRDPLVRASLVIASLLVPLSFLYIGPDVGALFSASSAQHLGEVARSAFPPNFDALSLEGWLAGSGVTLAMSLLSVAGAGALGLALSFPAANNLSLPGSILDRGDSGVLRRVLGAGTLFLTRSLLLVARSIPAPIWALILLFVLFPGVLPGAAALGLYTLGVLGRLMAEVIENLDERPLLALKSGGAGGGQVFTYGILPLTFPRFIGYLLYRWEEAIRATVMVGLVGAGGLGRMLVEQLSSFDYQSVAATLILFVAIIFLVDLISAAARRTFREV
jgi:phosphonate transport system permease protein